ncbi:MAG: septal ring lytic transglycosylase RlpA family protein [Nitrospirae bacterium]|nr:septal ring lytic transglycosylase RlpA family protein [Nitrospirota bacterium]
MTTRNTSIKHLAIVLSAILLASCASLPPPEYRMPPGEGYITASWYGADFHGRPTSSGERYDMYGLTAAHKEMDFGTRLRVTNPDNGKSVIVTVNDRGPFIPGRDLDLSYGAAREIDHIGKGVGLVKIEYLGRDMRYVKRVEFSPSLSAGMISIQVGSFIEKSNADRLKQGLDLKYSDVYITTFLKDNQKFYRVRIGRYDSRDSAYTVASKLANEGYTTLITSKE